MKKNKKNTRFSKVLFFLIICFLFLPLFQKTTTYFREIEIKGVYNLASKPVKTIETWFSGEYQSSYEKYYTDHIGFRGFFIKLYNQIDFSLFDKLNANSLVLGLDGYTYGQGYIENTISGKDFIGEARIDSILTKVKETQIKLKNELNIDLITVYAPSKEFVIPQFIPKRYSNNKIGQTNTECFIKKSKRIGLNFVDLNEFLINFNDTSYYPAYYKQGEHWSYYSMIKSGIYLVDYIEKIRKIDMPDINIVGLENSDTARYFDNDQGDAMNLLFDLKQDRIVYPILSFNESNKIKPKVLAIADCYYLHIFRSPIADNCFKNGGDFWFYNRQLSSKKYGDEQDISVVNKHQEIIKQDVIIHMITNQNLKDFGFGFFDEIDNLLEESKYKDFINKKEGLNKEFEEELARVVSRIKKNKEWFDNVKKEAKSRKISIEDMLERSAKHVIKSRS